MHGDEVHVIREFSLRLLPVKKIVGDGDRALYRILDLVNVLDNLLFGQFVIGPGNQSLIANAYRDNNPVKSVCQADSGVDLLRVFGLIAGSAVKPNAKHYLDPQLVVLDHFQHVLGVLIRAIKANQLPILIQNCEIFENLRLRWILVQLRALAHAIAGVGNGIAAPLLHGEINLGRNCAGHCRAGRQRRRERTEHGRFQKGKLHDSITPRRPFRSASIFTISASFSG